MRFAIAGLILASASGDTKVSPWEWDAPKGSMDAYLKPKYDEALAWKKKPDWSKSIDWAGDEEKDAKWGKQIDALDKEMLKDATTWTTPAPGTPIVMTAAEKAVLGDHPSLLQVKDTPLEAKMHAVEAKLRRAKDKLDREQAEQEVNAPAEASSFAEVRKTADSPDDGFAKVEAKLKALEEKMKSDAAKFEAEAKAPASSFIQTKDAPDDGFAKVEAKLKALEEKMKSDAAKFEAEAKAPASSFVETPLFGHERFEKLRNIMKAEHQEAKAEEQAEEDSNEKSSLLQESPEIPVAMTMSPPIAKIELEAQKKEQEANWKKMDQEEVTVKSNIKNIFDEIKEMKAEDAAREERMKERQAHASSMLQMRQEHTMNVHECETHCQRFQFNVVKALGDDFKDVQHPQDCVRACQHHFK